MFPNTPQSSSDAPSPASSTNTSANPPPPVEGKKKRVKSNIVYSQPADTGTGSNENTQLVYAVDFLRNNGGNLARLEDIAIHTSIPQLLTSVDLLQKFKSHERVIHDPKTNLYSYKSDFQFRNKISLLTEIQRHAKTSSSSGGAGGLSVRALKDSWNGAPAALEELEKEGEILVIRTNKDGQMKMVFWNEINPRRGLSIEEAEGDRVGEGQGAMVEKEFLDLWHSLRVPADADLVKALHSEGLQSTASEAVPARPPTGKKKGRKGAAGAGRQRHAKITNTHLKADLDLSRDWVPPPSIP